jgi:hypothetical protein
MAIAQNHEQSMEQGTRFRRLVVTGPTLLRPDEGIIVKLRT